MAASAWTPVEENTSAWKPVEETPPIKTEKPSALSRLTTNFLSGLGVTSDEDAKNFFEHPIHTALQSLNAQGELAIKARDAYNRGDYKSAIIHGLNYLVPFIGQQTDKAGEQLSEGDIAGGVGRTLGAAAPIVAGSPEARSAASSAASTVAGQGAKAVRATARGVNQGLAKAPGTVGAAVGAAIGGKFGGAVGAEVGGAAGALAGKELLPQVRIPGEGFGLPNRVQGGPKNITRTAPAPEAAAEAQPSPAAATPAETPSGAGIARTLSGDSAVRQVLTGQDNANLLKIARSRGINVTQEAQLKPGVADARIINKIVDDFSPEELQEFRDNYIEQTRMGKHDFGDIGPDAWKTMSMQTYFPDVKIPLARVLKTQKAIATAQAPKFAAQSARSIVIDPETGQPEFSDVVAAKKTATAAKPPAAAKAATATDDDLSSILEESVKKAKATRAARASQQ